MMSLGTFKLYYWLTFVWGAAGFLFIVGAVLRDVMKLFRSR